jgi:formylglycine-generating enzyme required for sulfatase activity/serine/threonine protein kinase
LEHLHSRHIIHRDLKPGNILLQGTTPRLVDFGLSRLMKNSAQSATVSGTLTYMPPEAFSGSRVYQTDIWSAGVILFEMLTGKLPFSKDTQPELILAILHQEPAPLPNTLPERIREVVQKSLSKSLDQRYQTAAQMKADLELAWRSVISSSGLSSFEKTEKLRLDSQINLPTAPLTQSNFPQYPSAENPPTPVSTQPNLPSNWPLSTPPPSGSNYPPSTPSMGNKTEVLPQDFIQSSQENQSWMKTSQGSGNEFGQPSPTPTPHDYPSQETVARLNDAQNPYFSQQPPQYPNQPQSGSGNQPFSGQNFTPPSGSFDPNMTQPAQNFMQNPQSFASPPPRENLIVPLQETPKPNSASSFQQVPSGNYAPPGFSQQSFQGVGETKKSKMGIVLAVLAVLLLGGIALGGAGFVFRDQINDTLAGYFPDAFQKTDDKKTDDKKTDDKKTDDKKTDDKKTDDKKTDVQKTNIPTPPENMAYISGGDFLMGRASGGDVAETPTHKKTVKPFFMDIYEVTNENYLEFVKATNHKTPPSWKNGTYPDGKSKFPVTGVNWDDANAYAKWAGKRLPTEEEWEFAARGTENRLYPYGDTWKKGMSNDCEEWSGTGLTSVCTQKAKALKEIGSQSGVSPFGLYDMVGNAWEWTSSEFKPYPGGKLPENLPKGDLRVIRGGSYESPPDFATTTYRIGWLARGASTYDQTSFRCVKDIP